MLQKIISIPLSIVYYLLFFITLLLFHPIQWVCFNCFGYKAHKKSVDIMNFFLLMNTYILGTRYKVEHQELLPQGVPVIIAANHQSMYDIITIGWFMRRIHPKYVSKIELSRGLPSISYNLNHGGSVVIKRDEPKQALTAIAGLGKYIEKNRRTAVIFPEGTRSRTGQPLPFAENGLKILCKYAPSAWVLPVTINHSWKMTRWGSFPLGLGNELRLTLHSPFPIQDMPFTEVFERTEKAVVGAIVRD